MLKNLMPYRLQEPFSLSAEELEKALGQHGFHPCQPVDLKSRGWAAAIPGTEALVHASRGFYLLRLRVEEKILPPAVVREFVAERVAEIEERELRKVRKRERDQLKDEVTFELLPRAFSRHKETLVLIDSENHWLIVDAGSWRQAEEATEFLRECIGTLPIAPPATVNSPQTVMTDWLLGEAPAAIEVSETVTLEDPATEGGVVTIRRQDLYSDETLNHIRAGLRVRRLEVSWAERIDCALDADYSVRKLRLSDVVYAEHGDTDAHSQEDMFDAELTLYALEIRGLLTALSELWGGLEGTTSASSPESQLAHTV